MTANAAQQVDFYLLKNTLFTGRDLFVCRLVEKAYKQKKSVYVYTQNEAHMRSLTALLWVYQDISFIPHFTYPLKLKQPAASEIIPFPIYIGCCDYQEQNKADVLINLHTEVPLWHNSFTRVIEIIPKDGVQLGRDHYRYYRQQNCQLATHDIHE